MSPDERELAGRRVVQNALWLLSQPIVLGLLSLALFSFAARRLGRVGLGVFGEASSFALLFLSFAGLGLSTVATREIARSPERAIDYAARLTGLRMLVAAVIALATGIAAWASGTGSRTQGLVFLAVLAIPLEQAVRTVQDLFIGLERARLVAIAQAAGAVVRIGLSFVLLLAGFGLWGFMIGWLAADLATLVCARLLAPDLGAMRPRLDRAFAVRVIRQGAVFYLAGMLTTAYQRLDVLILGRAAGHEELGIYVAAIGLVRRLVVVPDALGMATFASVSAVVASDRSQALELAARAHGLGLVIAVPIATATTLLAGPIVRTLFGPEFGAATVPLAIGVWALPLWCSSYVALYTLNALDRERQMLLVSAVIAVTAIGVLLAAGRALDATTSAAAVVAGQAVGTGLFLDRTRRELGSLVRWSELGRIGVATAAMAGVVALGGPRLPAGLEGPALLLPLGALVVAAAAVYLGAATALGLVPWSALGPRTRR